MPQLAYRAFFITNHGGSMKIEVKDGKFIITGELQPPTASKSGKTYIVASTGGFIGVTDEHGKPYSVSLNITTKEK